MGNTCCNRAVFGLPKRFSKTSSTGQTVIQIRSIKTGLEGELRDETLDQNNGHLINNRRMNGNSGLDHTDTYSKDELRSSGYSTGDKKHSSENLYGRSSYMHSNNKGDLEQHECDDESSGQYCYYGSDSDSESEEMRGLNQEEKDRISTNYTYLKKELDVDLLLDYFIQDYAFTDDQAERIRSTNPRRDQVDLFLRTLLMCRCCSAYNILIRSLDKIGCNHVRVDLESEHTELFKPDVEYITMRKAQKTLMRRRKAIVAQIEDPILIAEYFIVHREFSLDEYEVIFNDKTRKGRAEKLLDTVLDRNHIQRGYTILRHALRKEGYTVLTDNLEEETSVEETEDDSYELVSNGNTVAVSASEIEEYDEIRLILNVEARSKTQRKKEKRIVAKANKYKIKMTLNDNFLCETECLISDIEMGSIVIRIKGCRRGAIQRLFKTGTKEGVSKLLRMFFAHPNMSKEIYETSTTLQVTVELIPGQRKQFQDGLSGPKEIIESNFLFLVEELDAVCFLYLDIFTEEQKERISAARVQSRAKCTELMLDIILKKPEEEQLKFFHELKERKRFVWNHIYSAERTESFNDDVLVTDFKHFAENLSPSVFIDHCSERGILHASLLQSHIKFTAKHREQMVQMILQEVLLQDYRKRNEFLRILFDLNQIPPQTSLLIKEKDVAGLQKVSTDVRMIFDGTYRPVENKETDVERGFIKNIKDFLRDDESGYQSMSFRKRLSPRHYPEWGEEIDTCDYPSLGDLSNTEDALHETPFNRKAFTMERDNPMPRNSELLSTAHQEKRSQMNRSRSMPLLSIGIHFESDENLHMDIPGRLKEQKQKIKTLAVSPYI